MTLEITTFDHPSLRTPGARISSIDDSVRRLADDLIDTMREADGLGLAAQQVGVPLQMFVLDIPQLKKRPSVLRIDGKSAPLEAHMPMVLLNAEVETFGKSHTEGEGCLSFPDLSLRVTRPLSVRVTAQSLDGSEISFEADGLLARAVLHELDHTRGILFIDRAIPEDRASMPEDIRRLARPR